VYNLFHSISENEQRQKITLCTTLRFYTNLRNLSIFIPKNATHSYFLDINCFPRNLSFTSADWQEF